MRFARRFKGVFEIVTGLTSAYVLYTLNIVLFAVLYPLVEGRKEVIALIPVMSNLRGDILGSSASRINTLLHLGEVKPRVLELSRIEVKPTLPIAMITSIIIAFVTYAYTTLILGEKLGIEEMISVGFISSLLATLVLLPYIALAASEIYKRGWDPGNLLPTLATTAGDLVTLPFLIIAFLLVHILPSSITPLAFLTVTSISLSFYTALLMAGGRRVKRILRERFLVLLMVIVTHPLTGAFLAAFEEELKEMGLIHLATSFIGINGALAATAGVRLSSSLHLYGLSRLGSRYTFIALDVLLASVPAILLISMVGYTTHFLIPDAHPIKLSDVVVVVAVATVIHIAIGIATALVVCVASFKVGFDPDNVAIPVITNIMDLTGIPIIYVTSLYIIRP